MIPSDSFKLNLSYMRVFIVEIFVLLIACLLEVYEQHDKYLFFVFASMAMGIQNAITTTYSGNIIRTTAVTAPCTDVGIQFGRYLKGDSSELWKLFMLVPLILGFCIGSIAAGAAEPRWGRYSLVFSVMFFAILVLVYFVFILSYSNSVWEALTNEVVNISTDEEDGKITAKERGSG